MSSTEPGMHFESQGEYDRQQATREAYGNDTARLDWLDERGVRSIVFDDGTQLNSHHMSVRDVIDDGREVLESP